MRSCLDMLCGNFGIRRNKIPDKFVKKDMGEALLESPTAEVCNVFTYTKGKIV